MTHLDPSNERYQNKMEHAYIRRCGSYTPREFMRGGLTQYEKLRHQKRSLEGYLAGLELRDRAEFCIECAHELATTVLERVKKDLVAYQ